MKSQDIYILVKLVCIQQNHRRAFAIQDLVQEGVAEAMPEYVLKRDYSVRELAAALGVSKTEVSASIRRSIDSGMAIKDRQLAYPKVNKNALFEFIVHGLKYVFPVKPAEIVRGVSTAFFAPVLEGNLLSAGDYPYVWPYAEGGEKGQSIKPLFKSVPQAVLQDQQLYEYLALIDAIRLGKPREVNLAVKLLKQRLFNDE